MENANWVERRRRMVPARADLTGFRWTLAHDQEAVVTKTRDGLHAGEYDAVRVLESFSSEESCHGRRSCQASTSDHRRRWRNRFGGAAGWQREGNEFEAIGDFVSRCGSNRLRRPGDLLILAQIPLRRIPLPPPASSQPLALAEAATEP